MDYKLALNVASEAAKLAGGFIKKHAGRISHDDIREKDVHDVVTFVDEEAQRLIIEKIASHFPDHEFLAEESVHEEWQTVADGFRWIIDPLDGTTNFTHSVPPYSVSIALQYKAELMVGVIYDVTHDELFCAIKGEGLTLNGQPAGVSKIKELSRALITTGFPYKNFNHIDIYLAALKAIMLNTQGVRRPGSAATDLAWVACGRFDGFFEIGLSPWDIAAGVLLVQEGGGKVDSPSGDGSFLFTGNIVASNTIIFTDILKLVDPLKSL